MRRCPPSNSHPLMKNTTNLFLRVTQSDWTTILLPMVMLLSVMMVRIKISKGRWIGMARSRDAADYMPYLLRSSVHSLFPLDSRKSPLPDLRPSPVLLGIRDARRSSMLIFDILRGRFEHGPMSKLEPYTNPIKGDEGFRYVNRHKNVVHNFRQIRHADQDESYHTGSVVAGLGEKKVQSLPLRGIFVLRVHMSLKNLLRISRPH
jgi:hypothetical protein